MLISPFTPLFFGHTKSDGVASPYIQAFSRTDRILLEVFAAAGETVTVTLADHCGAREHTLMCNSYGVNASLNLVFTVISGLYPGVYSVGVNGNQSELFRVTDDADELAATTLIQYSMKDNRRRSDALFVIGGMRYFFDFRIPGGFKDSGWAFAVDNEQFVTADADPVELYAIESTQKVLTIGTQEGVPVRFAELLNRLLTCTYVYCDGVRYARKDSAAPEMNVQIEGVDSFVFTQNLQRVNNLDPLIESNNQIALRRLDESLWRAVDADNIRTT